MRPIITNMRSPIVVKLPPGVNEFDIRDNMFHMIHNNCMFSGDSGEDPADHINTFKSFAIQYEAE